MPLINSSFSFTVAFVSAAVPVKQEELTSYEGGAKLNFFDHRLQLNVSAYYMQWQNVQFYLFSPIYGINTTFGINGPDYDIKGVDFGHVGDRCSFDAIIRILDIKDPALDQLATIVRGADTSRPDLAPQCEGLLAISYGLSANFPDDHAMLKHGMVIYDALYTWCRKRQA